MTTYTINAARPNHVTYSRANQDTHTGVDVDIETRNGRAVCVTITNHGCANNKRTKITAQELATNPQLRAAAQAAVDASQAPGARLDDPAKGPVDSAFEAVAALAR